MQEEQIAEKKCANCRYFVLHYFNLLGLFKPMDFGHCIHGKRISNKNNFVYCNQSCQFWESNQDKIEQKNKSIESAIYKIVKDLNHYLQTLKLKNKQ